MQPEQAQKLRIDLIKQLEESHHHTRQLVSGLVDLTFTLPTLDFNDDAQMNQAMRYLADVMDNGGKLTGAAFRISQALTEIRWWAQAGTGGSSG